MCRLFNENKTENNLIVIEGIIGSGKTTLGKILKFNIDNCIFIEEQVDNDLLKQFIQDMKRYVYPFQLSMLIRRHEAYLKALWYCNNGYKVILDRSLIGDQAFIQTQYQMGNLEKCDYEMLLNLLQKYTSNLPKPKTVIYLDTNIDTAMKRIQNRNRSGEDKYQREYQCYLRDNYIEVLRNYSDIIKFYDWNEDYGNVNSIPIHELISKHFQ